MILVGNKCDQPKQRVISKESGQMLADEYNIELLMEISAFSNINIKEVSIKYVHIYVII